MKAIGYTSTLVVFTFINSIWSGYALSILWAWFIVSTFSLPELSIPAAIGIALTISYLTHQDIPVDNKSRDFGEILLEGIAKGLTKPSIALLIGLVVTLFL